MKNIIFTAACTVLLFTSCAMHDGLTRNANLNSTEVVLAKNNFKIIARTQGSSKATYVLGIGGLSKNALVTEARNKMLSNANILGRSKAVINETVEIKRSFFLIVGIYEVTVSGHVIEFTD